MTAMLTSGLFGLPTSAFAIIIPAAALKLKLLGRPAAGHLCAVVLATTFIAQWLLLAVLLFRRSKFHNRAAMWDRPAA